jgi:hypothetical protein
MKWIPRRIRIEWLICHLSLDYFFVGIIKQLLCLPTMSTILVLWNMKFNYYKEQPLELAIVKHKLKGGTSFRTKCMKWFETKDTTMEIQLALLDQIHFPTCMYITMWRRITIGWLKWNLMNFASSLQSKRSFVVSRFLLKEMFCTARRSWDYHAIR